MIGLHVKVAESRNASLQGIEGEVVDETRNMLSVETTDGVKEMIKSSVVLEIDGSIVDGKDIVGRTEERIKRIK